MSVFCCACFSMQLISNLPLLLVGLFYTLGVWASDAMIPLTNALYVSYNQRKYSINYGISRGIGSAATALSSLAIGFLIARLGSIWMIIFLITFRLICFITLVGFPKIQKMIDTEKMIDTSCSILEFFIQYKWYCASLVGILFFGMFHAMTENYMIAIMEHLGGNSSHVGTALFIAAMVGAIVITFFSIIREHFCDNTLIKIGAASFLIKAVLFYFASNITAIYLIQLLQATSYVFLVPTLVFYSSTKVRDCDMVKGQAFSTAAYALGCSAGNFVGGQLLTFGVETMLGAGIAMTTVGTIILFMTVEKHDY